jgi:hypothetical protein
LCIPRIVAVAVAVNGHDNDHDNVDVCRSHDVI